ncbi:DUF1570 domain-containing protein [Singulisphaera acidiphila]|uniref:Type IV secretory pathway, VirB10 component n=1 Tax=Singulisphaera acidiphila (strain ATCC BAA-1392 / DSM 18658 / VKM B-2454 / MOB10) TaxID=886293 RepID=L0DK46_SINAD|nr:DUF1570 domain-containing protein [Singulisphaera acidiphila]AGA29215.1 type IV secretory pathway, VirB10 component [Singulisphaera acidiphila DSM 18658]
MGPVTVTCDGCGVRIRIPKPEAALDRQCPRCSTPLASALAKVFEVEAPRNAILGIDLDVSPEAPRLAEARPKSSGFGLLAACALVFVGSALMLGLWLARGSQSGNVATPEPNRPPALAVNVRNPAAPTPVPPDSDEGQPAKDETSAPTLPPEPQSTDEAKVEVAATPSAPNPMLIASTAPAATRELIEPPFKPAAEPVAPPPAPAPTTLAPAERQEKRVRIRTKTGETVVARLHGQADGKTCVLLPNGEIGFTTGLAETDEPFLPATREQIEQELTRAGPFANFEVLQSEHYLVLYQSSTPFAEASIKLLESLYENLTDAFRKRELPIHEAEFPLVAIIFQTEKQFRAHQQVDADVQAYYEILSNRIYLYEKSDRDQQAPEVAALRKPQTVAHEGTHQILQNIGIHPRMAAWPLWLVEGFAEYCSPPTMTRRGAAWGGLGQVNPMHMATIHDLDDPASLYVKGSERQRLGRDRRKPLVEYLITRSSLTPTDYALSWALTHYLAMQRGTEFLAFIRTMSQLPPLEERTPEQHLASFREAFGTDLAKLDKKVAGYLSKLKFDPLPYYAVVFEQPIPGNQIRRATIVSQSPSMIRQWLSQISDSNGGQTSWEVFPHPTRARAQMAAEQWISNH